MADLGAVTMNMAVAIDTVRIARAPECNGRATETEGPLAPRTPQGGGQ